MMNSCIVSFLFKHLCTLAVTFCEVPTQIPYGGRNVSSLMFGAEAKYSCDVGYNMIGDKVLKCNQTQPANVSTNATYPETVWSSAPPKCEG